MSTIDRNELLRDNSDLFSRYRLVTEEDIKPGAELFMSFVGLNRKAEWAQPIHVDDEPFKEHLGKPYVFYCYGHRDGFQCFVPKDWFIGVLVTVDLCGPYLTTLYLAKRN